MDADCFVEVDDSPLRAAEVGPFASIADRLDAALWIYDFDAARIVWANAAALRLWDAPSAAALAARDLGAEMSAAVRARLAQHREDFRRDRARVITEFWTLYPEGKPFRVRASLRGCDLADGRCAMLVEAHPEDGLAPTTVRSANALLHTPVIVALFDRDGAELYANPAFRAAFGPGRHDFAASIADPEEARAFRAAVGSAGERRATVRVRTVEGERWHDIHAAACRDGVTGDGAFLLSAFDVTEAVARERRLAEALAAAEAAEAARSRFLSVMSHELRTPLNGVLGMAGVLDATGLTPAQRRMLGIVVESGREMLDLVEDMLAVADLDRGAVRLVIAPFDPVETARAALESVRAQAERKGLALALDAAGVAPGTYAHDARRVATVLRHLLSNAVKFTPHGDVRLRAETVGGGLRFVVEDSGPGVPEAERARVFERFHQLDSSSTRRHGGAGLGLALCRDLVTLWGGAIGVECPKSGGSTFWFDAPGALGGDASR